LLNPEPNPGSGAGPVQVRHRFRTEHRQHYAVSAVLIFFIFQYPMNGNIGIDTIQVWWENTVWLNTADEGKTPLIALADGDPFASSMW
jgi:hypothetical protein